MKNLITALSFLVISGCATTTEEAKVMTEKEKAVYLIQMAAGALQGGDPTQALKDLLEAEKLVPDMPELHYTRALAYFAKQELQLAVDSTRTALQIKPDYSAALNTLGKLMMDLGRYQDAEKPLLKAAGDLYNREAFKARTNLAILYYKLGRETDSEREVNRAISAEPEYACVAYFYRGNLMMKKQKFSQAIDDYGRASRKLCGNFSNAYYMQAVAFMKNRQTDLARKQYLQVTKLFPGTEDARRAMDQLRYLPK